MNKNWNKLYKEYLTAIDMWYGEEDKYKELLDEINKVENEQLKPYSRYLYLRALKEYKKYLDDGMNLTKEYEELISTLYENEVER